MAENVLRDNLHSRMIAIAISIMSTWWYPRNGINRWMPTANRTFGMMAETVYRLSGEQSSALRDPAPPVWDGRRGCVVECADSANRCMLLLFQKNVRYCRSGMLLGSEFFKDRRRLWGFPATVVEVLGRRWLFVPSPRDVSSLRQHQVDVRKATGCSRV